MEYDYNHAPSEIRKSDGMY